MHPRVALVVCLLLAVATLSTTALRVDSLPFVFAPKSFAFVAKSNPLTTKSWIYSGNVHFDAAKGVVAEVNETHASPGGLHSRRRIFFANDKAVQLDDEKKLECLSPSDTPPLTELLSLLPKASPLTHNHLISSITKRCDKAAQYVRIGFAAKTFILCLSLKDNKINGMVFGEDFEASLTEIGPSPYPQSISPDEIMKTCPGPVYRDLVPMSLDDSHSRDSWWFPPLLSPKLLPHSVFKVSSSSNSTLVLKPCVFLHGSGESNPRQPTTTFTDYWGNLQDFTPQCSSRTFIHADTRNNGWNSEFIQKQYCEAALGGQHFSITNKYIFTHSMGNLILAAAINNSLCAIGPGTQWYSIGNPARGSGVAQYLDVICQNNSSVVVRKIAQLIGACDSQGFPIPSYASLKPTNPAFPVVLPILAKLVNGEMCGTSSAGLTTQYAAALDVVAAISKLASPNDGLVEALSCKLRPEADWHADPSHDFYLPSVNHADATCRNGNGWFGAYRQPCSWYTGRGQPAEQPSPASRK